jgi:putative ABC transport system permease protein
VSLGTTVRLAVRSLARTPGYALLVVATLALAIAAATAMFAVANEAVLRPLPMREPDRLVRVWDRGREGGNRAMSPAAWAALRERRDVFESVGGSADVMSTLTGAGEPESILGYRFAAGFFETLGVAPALGRTFSAEDDRPGAPPVVVLSHRLWQRRLGGDPAVVGRTLTLSGQAHTVIGVMPRGFVHPPTVELWVPLALEPAAIENPRARFVRTVARLREGVGLPAARRAVDEVSRRLLAEKPEAVFGGGLRLETMDENVRGDARTPVLALLGAVGFVLLVACANVAGLSLARAATRRRDLAVRVALGASRARLVGEALVETALLAAAGGAFGLLLASWAAGFLPALFPSTIANLSLPKVESVPVGLPVALFAVAVTTLAALVAGAVPALHAAVAGPSESLQSSSRSVAGDHRRVLPLIVASEVGLALVLLVGAGLLLRSFLHLRGGDAGFDATNVVTGRLILTGERYGEPERVRALHDGVLARLRATPGVEAAGSVTFLPLSGWSASRAVRLEGEARPAEGQEREARINGIDPGYFGALRVQLRAGRAFDERDGPKQPPAVIVSEGLARRLFPGRPVAAAVGRRIVFGLERPGEPPSLREIVGVAGDVRQDGPERPPEPTVYLAFAQGPIPFFAVTVRGPAGRAVLERALKQAVWAEDPQQPVSYLMPLESLASEALTLRRLSAVLVAAFAVAALLLAALGVYGVVSQVVGRSTREIGLRVALGATRASVVAGVLSRSLKPAAWGAAAGLAGSFAVARLLRGLLFGVAPEDPAATAAAAVALLAAASLAAWLPARRAARIEPAVALREE